MLWAQAGRPPPRGNEVKSRTRSPQTRSLMISPALAARMFSSTSGWNSSGLSLICSPHRGEPLGRMLIRQASLSHAAHRLQGPSHHKQEALPVHTPSSWRARTAWWA